MPNFDIRITNEVKTLRVSSSFLRKKVQEMLRRLGWRKAGLSIQLVSDRKIQALNRRYLKHNRPTDVIAFGPLEGPKIPSKIPWLGDIVVSLETTKRQARVFGNSFTYELCFYICHGILHIMGYRDKSKREAEQMERMQKRILKQIGI